MNVKDRNRATALMYAAGEGHVEAVKLFLDHGADVNVKTNTGWTALSVAERFGHLRVIQLLEQAVVKKVM